MKLYHSPTSPYVRKVEVLLREIGQLDAVEIVPSMTNPVQPAAHLPAVNPLMKIPALERPDGATLYDSRVITGFLNAHFEAGLYGSGAREWEIRTLEATGDGIMDAALLLTMEQRMRPPEQQSQLWLDAQWAKIAGALDALDARWISHLQGPLDLGQISVACALGYLDFRHDSRKWRDGRGELASWYAEFAQRDAMKATVPPEGA